MPIKGTYLALAGGGLIMVYSGLKGTRWSDTLRQIIAGKDPKTVTTAYELTTNVTGNGVTSTSGGGLAQTFASYAGHVPYRWGGANPHGWDCSGAFNYVANHDVGIRIPSYSPHQFAGNTHGPNTLVYWGWLPAHASHINRSDIQANDICLWQTHMGVAVSNTRYVSAYDTAEGTIVKDIHKGGPIGELATFWRLR